MQTFQDTATLKVYQFNDDVLVTSANGVYSFATAANVPLTSLPTTLVPYTIPTPTAAQLLANAQSIQVSTLTAACANAIIGNYTSNALGSTYSYPNKITDQINLLSAIASSQLANTANNWTTSFWCASSSNTWNYQPHTAVQIQQVGIDNKTWVATQQAQLASLKIQVTAANTVAAVQAVVWSA
jgi:hypothetical protein